MERRSSWYTPVQGFKGSSFHPMVGPEDLRRVSAFMSYHADDTVSVPDWSVLGADHALQR